MAQTQEVISSYPLPDPAWDYATLWDFLHKAQGDLGNLIQYTPSKSKKQRLKLIARSGFVVRLRRDLSRTLSRTDST